MQHVPDPLLNFVKTDEEVLGHISKTKPAVLAKNTSGLQNWIRSHSEVIDNVAYGFTSSPNAYMFDYTKVTDTVVDVEQRTREWPVMVEALKGAGFVIEGHGSTLCRNPEGLVRTISYINYIRRIGDVTLFVTMCHPLGLLSDVGSKARRNDFGNDRAIGLHAVAELDPFPKTGHRSRSAMFSKDHPNNAT